MQNYPVCKELTYLISIHKTKMNTKLEICTTYGDKLSDNVTVSCKIEINLSKFLWWHLLFTGKQVNLMQPFPLPDDALHETDQNWPLVTNYSLL